MSHPLQNKVYLSTLHCDSNAGGGIHPSPCLHTSLQVGSQAKLLYEALEYDRVNNQGNSRAEGMRKGAHDSEFARLCTIKLQCERVHLSFFLTHGVKE